MKKHRAKHIMGGAAKHHDGVKSNHGGRKPSKPPKGRLKGALMGGQRPGGKSGVKGREKRLEGKPL